MIVAAGINSLLVGTGVVEIGKPLAVIVTSRCNDDRSGQNQNGGVLTSIMGPFSSVWLLLGLIPSPSGI